MISTEDITVAFYIQHVVFPAFTAAVAVAVIAGIIIHKFTNWFK